MEFVFEIIGTFIFELIFEVGFNKKISKWIRYPVLLIFISLYLLLTGGIIFLGIKTLKNEIIGGVMVIGLGIALFVGVILAFKYKLKEQKDFV